jgi:hypothetical protein
MSICQQFHANPNINPRTGHSIERNKGTYNSLVKECGPPPLLSPHPNTSSQYTAWSQFTTFS